MASTRPAMAQLQSLTFALFILILVAFVPAFCVPEDLAVCPTDCECKTAQEATCTNSTVIPNFAHPDLVVTLTIKNHNITSIKKGDLDAFVKIQHFQMIDGNLSVIEAGVFDVFADTVIDIVLSNNLIENLNKSIFANMKNLNKIDIANNKITAIKAETFVNLTTLSYLELKYNMLATLEANSFVNLPALTNLDFFKNSFREIPFESLSGLTALQDLAFTNNEISAIPRWTAVSLPALTDLRLDSNPLYHIRTFPNVSANLKILNLQFTHLTSFSPETWKYLGNLEQLYINGLRIVDFKTGMFTGLGKLQSLQAMHMLNLKTVGADAFSGMDTVKTIDLRFSKKLMYVDGNAFMSTPNLQNLFLANCSVSFLAKKLVKWSEMREVSVSHNPINCDCKMGWVLESVNFGEKGEIRSEFQDLKCVNPEALKGKTIGSLTHDQLTCKSLDADEPRSRLVTGVIVAVICLVFMTTIALVTMYRKKISMSCRRYYQYRRYKNDMVFTVEQDTSIAELEDTVETRPLRDIKLETVPL